MKTNNTIINSIVKFICAVVMVLGVSVNAWGTTETFNFATNAWGFSTSTYDYGVYSNGSGKVVTCEYVKLQEYPSGTYNGIQLKVTSKENAVLKLPTFPGAVSKIEVYTISGSADHQYVDLYVDGVYKTYEELNGQSAPSTAATFNCSPAIAAGSVIELQNSDATILQISRVVVTHNGSEMPAMYKIEYVSDDEDKGLVSGPSYATVGETVEFNLYPKDGYTNYGVVYYDETYNGVYESLDPGENEFTMPAYDITVYAFFTDDACTANPTIGAASVSSSFTLSSNTGAITASSGTCSAGTSCAWTDYGFVWGTSSTPTVSNNKVQVGTSGSGTSWNGSIQPSGSTSPTTWSTGTTYYVRTYGKNGKDAAAFTYGTATSFSLQSIAFNSNGGSSVGPWYVKSGGTYSAPTAPTKTGYDFSGWYTDNGTFSSAVDWTAAVSENKTYYAKWTAHTHSLHWYKNADDADDLTGSYTDGNAIEYGATITAPNTPTFTGHTFEGWSTTSSGSTTDPETSMPDEDLEYYAIWSLNSHKVSVASPANIAIKATPSGESAIEEGGSNASVDYGTSVTLSYTGLSAGYAINRWKVTKDEDESDVTASVVEGNTLTMPDYDVTVDVILYAKAKMKTRCLEFDVEGNVWLTSYAGVEVYTTDNPENRITITCDDWGDADRMYVSYYNGAGESVAKASSLFRVCDASTYNKVDATNNYFSISGTTHASGVKYVISYNPGASRYDQEDTWTIRFTAQSGASTILGYKDLVVHGRALPEYFAIASKFNNKWYALPNTILRNNSAITPIEIIVDNTTTPTAAVYAPTTVKYKGGARYAAGSNRYGISILAPNDSILKIRKNSNYVYVSKQGSTIYQDWCLQSTDFGAYTMWVPSDDSDNAPSKMGIYGGNIGYYKSPTSPSEQIYLLPITNELTPNDASVTEWGQKSVILDVDAQSPIVSAQAFFGDRASAEVAASLAQTRTSVKESASKYNYTLTFSTLDFSDHKGELLYIDWLNSSDAVVSTSSVSIPWIIAESTTMGEISAVQNYWKDWEVHVLPGVTLEADGNSFSSASNTAKVRSLEIYPGATVKVTSGTLDVSQDLVLRNGWTRAGEKDYEVARLYIGSASLTTNRVYADWYIDYDQYYPIAVPWDVTVANMSYKNTTGAVSVGPGNSNTVRLRYYDGNSRATNIQQGVGDGANWKQYGEGSNLGVPTTLTPSHGYAMTARRPTGKAFSIIRMPLTIPSASWTASGEQGEVGGTHKDQVTVTAYGVKDKSETAYAEGWNFIANPYMALYQGTITLTPAEGDATTINVVNIPDVDFKEYGQYATATTKLKPSSGFLIQTPATGTITFGTANRKASAPSYRKTTQAETYPEQQAYIVLNDETSEDMMGIFVSDKYTADYDLNGDVEKLLSNSNSLRTYMRYGEMNMAYVAINETLAKEWIPVTVRIPESGEYTYSLHEASIASELEGVYLIDYANGDHVTNLIEESYSFVTEAGTISNRFAINAIVGKHDTPTSIDIINAGGDIHSDKPVKFIYRDKVYILNRGVIYDSTGKKVREINK